jgi:glycosyltransferase involved in cell wall biosynthesis
LADVLVLPSHTEGSPNVLLEAMAAGCPIVATRVGGVPETVTDGETALVIPAHDPAAMAEAMERLLTDRELGRRMGAKAREVAETQFSPDEYSRAMIRIYCQVLGQPV